MFSLQKNQPLIH